MARQGEERDLLTADEVARYLDLRPTTIYQWCREGRLPALKLGKEWRIRRSTLEMFLAQSERRVTLTAQLQAFLTVPDDVLGIVENSEYLHRLDTAFFQVGETRSALLVKFTRGEQDISLNTLRAALTGYGLAVAQLEAEGQMRFIAEIDPFEGRAQALRDLLATDAAQGRLVFASFNWTEKVDLATVMRQRRGIAEIVNMQQLVVTSCLLQSITDEWSSSVQREAQDTHTGVVWLGEQGLGLRRIVPLPPA